MRLRGLTVCERRRESIMKKLGCLTAFVVVAISHMCLAEDNAKPLREMILKNAEALRGKTVYLDVFGQPMRSTFTSADESGITIEAMGQTLPLPWEQVKPQRLMGIAIKAAGTTDGYGAVARYAHAEGLDDEARQVLDDAATKFPDAAEAIAALRKELFPEAPKPVVEEKPAPSTAAEQIPSITSKVLPTSVSTFHCLSVYWSPEGGEAGKKVMIKFREAGQKEWRDGLPMRLNKVDTKESKGDYRGSIVNLKPGTSYEIVLFLEGTETRTAFRAATWSEQFPVASVVKGQSSTSTVSVGRSGTPEGYVLYDGTGAVIDTANKSDVGIMVDASYVIIRGYTVRNVKQFGIRLNNCHNVVIENCDISKWGSEDEKGFGVDCQGGLFSNTRELRSVVVQRCKIHHPSWDSNSWAEDHNNSRHPGGQQTIVFWESEGNHVFRYNELWSDEEHYFNDVMGAGQNSSYRGFPGADTDIYCNYIANCWDDGIEAEGGGQNVRIWGNYLENVMMAVGNAAVSIGPLYAWRNVSGRSYSPPGSSWDLKHGYFFKMGFAGGEEWMTGHMYIFSNTIFQPNGEGAGGLGGSSKVIKHCVTRNNILHARDNFSIASADSSTDNDFDSDLLSGRYPSGQEKHGVGGTPRYVPGAGFSFDTKTGDFELAPGGPGYDRGVIIPNFCDVFTGNGPDMGAQEAGTVRMQFGVKAEFVPPGTTPQGPPTAVQ